MGITAPGSVWEAHVDVWSEHFKCITPDNRGVGQSDKPPGDYTSAIMADDYASLMNGLGIEKAHIVGCSMGSIIGQQLALRHPEKVQSLVLMCSWARCDAYAKSTFEHMKQAKAHLTPAAFMEWIHVKNSRLWSPGSKIKCLVLRVFLLSIGTMATAAYSQTLGFPVSC